MNSRPIPRPFSLGILGTVCVMLCACSAVELVKKSISMEQRLFLRVPGPLPKGSSLIVDEPGLKEAKRGWRFKHVIEAPAVGNQPIQWYVAWYQGEQRNTLKGHRWLPWLPQSPDWSKAHEMTVELAEASLRTFGAYPQLIEPCLVFDEKVAGVGGGHLGARARSSRRQQGPARLGELPDKVWPSVKKDGLYDPVWHLGGDYSQLAYARDKVRANSKASAASRQITVGILDNGFDDRHITWPKQVIDKKEGDAVQALLPAFSVCDKGCIDQRTTPGQSLGSHGTGALGILAGRKVILSKEECEKEGVRYDPAGIEIGGAPDAHIVTVRVAPEMLSLSTANFAYGIDYASRVQGCDIISMSHGGSPSQMWADAINAAYARGTAMFAATGDYFCSPLLPFHLNRLSIAGIIPAMPPPSSTVYPAAWRRVMGVAGITASGKSYALTDYGRLLKHPLTMNTLFSMRGSYGADDVRRGLLDALTFTEHWKTDPSMRRRFNELRANPVSAYSPGIPWPKVGSAEEKDVHMIDLDGGGTSAATPQAAAAAAHWLAYHKQSIPAKDWSSWRKAEAVYTAMVFSALRPWEMKSGRKPEDQRPDVFLGAGILKAADMLDVTYEQAKAMCGDTLRFPRAGKAKWREEITPLEASKGVPKDYYDGQRGFFAAVVNPLRYSTVPGGHRAELREECFSKNCDPEKAYRQLFYNMLLVERWQLGYSPVKTGSLSSHPFRTVSGWFGRMTGLGPMNEPDLKAAAGQLARKVTGKKSSSPAQ